MHHSHIVRLIITFFIVSISFLCLCPLPAIAGEGQTYQVRVDYPKDVTDERGRPFNQAVKVEFYRILSEQTKQEMMEKIEKLEHQTDSAARKESLEREISRISKMRTRLEYTHVLNPTSTSSIAWFVVSLPEGQYEVHFLPINPANRKPCIVPLALTSSTYMDVVIAPQGGIIGGGPTIAELQAQIAELQERVKKLEEKR